LAWIWALVPGAGHSRSNSVRKPRSVHMERLESNRIA
jgi:hypothetical protein